MQDLTLVGVHDDGEHLVLAVGDDRFLVPIDDALRDAVHPATTTAPVAGETSSHAAAEAAETSDGGVRARRLRSATEPAALRPRDIQARIRAGASPEQVAADAGVPIDLVRRYESPVLAEREHVARLAFTTGVRRSTPAGERGTRTVALGELVTERLVARGVDPEDQDWDAWRADGDHWVVQMTFAAAGRDRVARWHFHPVRGTVTAADDESRWLSEDLPADSGSDSGPLAGSVTSLGGGRRLSAVVDAHEQRTGRRSDRVYDVEADGGVRPADEDEAVTSRRAATLETGLLDALRARRGRRQPVVLDGGADDPEAATDQMAAEQFGEPSTSDDDAPGRPAVVPAVEAEPGGTADLFGEAELWESVPAAHPPASHPDQAVDAEILALPDEPLPTSDLPAGTDPAVETVTGATTAVDTPDDAAIAEEADTTATAPDLDRAAQDTPGQDTPGQHTAVPDASEESAEKVASRRGRDGRPGAPRPRRAGARRSRASVPSWDDIVFGAKTD